VSAASYRNRGHYLAEGWSREPKESFKALAAIAEREGAFDAREALDVGCATGELIGYLATLVPGCRFTGVDVGKDLLAEAGRLLPRAEFVAASVLDLPPALAGRFDLVTAIGCMSIFDETEIGRFWDSLLAATRPGGLVIVLAPMNEFGVDTMIRHRKRIAEEPGAWETGWNVFAHETIAELLAARGCRPSFERFQIPIDLPRRPDPVRTWTMPRPDGGRQLTNGLKLLVDHWFTIVRKPAAPAARHRS
jgi:SAM-dependent methyltransferase